jgi:hypothetical protein
LQRQAGVAQVITDMPTNLVFVTYKPGIRFDPAMLREAAKEAETVFVRIQIMARGRIVEETSEQGTEHFFVAGEDRFSVMEPGPTGKPLPPVSELVSVVASVDDRSDPIKVKIVQSTPVPPSPAE